MKNWKKILTLAVFIWVMTGCGLCHKNIVKSVAKDGLLIVDVITGEERIIGLSKRYLENVRQGDTVLVRAPYYEERFVLQADISTVIYFNYDSMIYRQNKAEFEARKQEMFNTNTK